MPNIPYINARNLSAAYYKPYYNIDTKKVVEKFFQRDIDEFKYTYEEPIFFPASPQKDTLSVIMRKNHTTGKK